MERSAHAKLHIGAWTVDPASGEISRGGETARLEVRAMRLLVCLAERPGEVVSIDDLLDQVWSGVIVSPDSVYQAVASLRRVLGDDSREPTYIATVPRLGYRMVATVRPWLEVPNVQSTERSGDFRAPTSQPRFGLGLGLAAGALLCVVIVGMFVFRGELANHNPSASAGATPQPEKSIAVLPFLDLTEGMKEEEFADGMTEELIDKFSKVPGLRVTPPTSSFYFKNKKISVADVAKALGVAYVLDGSVRKSGGRVRVAARLIRADTGYVAWSETYDRPWDDIVMVQDDIAGEVTRALRASL